jgi:outer membrane protein assembly factor BamA
LPWQRTASRRDPSVRGRHLPANLALLGPSRYSRMMRRSPILMLLWTLAVFAAPCALAQSVPTPNTTGESAPQSGTQAPAPLPGLRAYQGKTVVSIEFRGVTKLALDPLPAQLPQQPGEPLDPAKVRDSLRRLYASGLYDGIALQGEPAEGGVKLIFAGTARSFFGTTTVVGVKSDRLTSQLARSAGLDTGTAFSQAEVDKGRVAILQSLEISGFHESKVTSSQQADPVHGLMNVTYQVTTGAQARIGDVESEGETGMDPAKFRKVSKLKPKRKVTQDTTRNALHGLRSHYQKEDRLEAKITLEKENFQQPTNVIDYGFLVDRGPVVKFVVDGAHVSRGKLQSLLPVFQEGSVDEDLLNEGSRNLRNYFQEHGYFDAKISHRLEQTEAAHETIVYDVVRGSSHRVGKVEVKGNKYFDSATLRERLSVTKADVLLRYGRYSELLVNKDVDSITNLYQSNGFRDVKVSADVQDEDKKSRFISGKLSILNVTYTVEEGPQTKFGKVSVSGTKFLTEDEIRKLMNTTPGQPYSLINLSGDRETILNYYLEKGFENAQLDVAQTEEKGSPQVMDISFRITEGPQVFIHQVFISGLHYTKPFVVQHELQIHPGDPLNQSALVETQRRLYDLALFNQVDTAIENPTGDQTYKNVLLDLQEAKRWDFTYGFGLQAQTGNPNTNCPSVATLLQLGIDPSTYHCSPEGKTGASGLVSFDLTRINLRGRDQTITLHTVYGSLEQAATLIFSDPHFHGNPNLAFSVSGGYTSDQDVTTFASSRLEGNVQVQQIFGRTSSRRPLDTLIYRFAFRRVKVDPQSIQVAADEIPLLSQPARVGGPGLTYIRDRRDSPLDAHHGYYFTLQSFLSSSLFGSQSDFMRFDATHSSYYSFGKRRWVLARSTRYGSEIVYGNLGERTIPLPERLFAGGATSHRGFAINQAGPRDTQTGYPLGGSGAFVNSTELRTPPAQLPLVGNNLSFVLFHDVGNVYQEPGQVFSSFFNWRQPNRGTCANLATSGGLCNFNYMSSAVGLGLRYATPIGPIRVDVSDNLNPPVYPVLVDPINGPHVGELSHFNFFFSLGQSF